jgi:uncharacterized protein YbcI
MGSERAARMTPGGSGLSELSAGISRVFSERWGRGPRKCRVHWAGDDVLLVLLEDGHTQSERTLRGAGHVQEILSCRRALQRIVEDDMRRLVAQTTGREVDAVLSATRLEPDLSAEIFVLAPSGAGSEALPSKR